MASTDFTLTPTEIAFLLAWHNGRLCPSSVSELLPITAAARINLPGASRKAQLSRLGLWLAKRRGQPLHTPAGTFRVIPAGIYDGRQRWRIESIGPATSTDKEK